jgi:hypothetical protein
MLYIIIGSIIIDMAIVPSSCKSRSKSLRMSSVTIIKLPGVVHAPINKQIFGEKIELNKCEINMDKTQQIRILY